MSTLRHQGVAEGGWWRHRRRGSATLRGVSLTDLPDGFVAVVKRDCPTCTLVAPLLVDLTDVLGRGPD